MGLELTSGQVAIEHYAAIADKTGLGSDIQDLQNAITNSVLDRIQINPLIGNWPSTMRSLVALTGEMSAEVEAGFGEAIIKDDSENDRIKVDCKCPSYTYGYNDSVKQIASKYARRIIGDECYEDALNQCTFNDALVLVSSVLENSEVGFNSEFVMLVMQALNHSESAQQILDIAAECGSTYDYLGNDEQIAESFALSCAKTNYREITIDDYKASRRDIIYRSDIIARIANLSFMYSQIYRDLGETPNEHVRTNGKKKSNFADFDVMVLRKIGESLKLLIEQSNVDHSQLQPVLEIRDGRELLCKIAEVWEVLSIKRDPTILNCVAKSIVLAGFEIWKDIYTQKETLMKSKLQTNQPLAA